jgi:hypothetical protein
MKKMIVLEECFQCPHSFKFSPPGDLECDLEEKTIPDPYTIPKWCPLPNAPLKDNTAVKSDASSGGTVI